MLNAVQKSLTIVVVLAIVISSAEEIETRKTVKKSAAIHVKSVVEARAEELSTDEALTAEVEGVKETSTSASKPVPTTVQPPSTTTQSSTTATQSPSSSTRPPTTTTQSPTTTTRLTTAAAEEVTTEKQIETSTKLPVISTTSGTTKPTVDSEISITDLDNESTPDESTNQQVSLPDIDDLLPFKDPPKRKVIYINQQQNGKLNVHLELSDVSLIVIPNQKDQNQLSLLNLLFKSAQKSKMQNDNEEKKKEEKINSVDNHDDYSKYKETFKPTDENYHLSTGNMPFVESRAPYKVEISSTLGQQSQPAVEIMPNAQQSPFQPQFARSPMMQLLRPIPYTLTAGPWSGQAPPNDRLFKRSIDSRFHDVNSEILNDFDSYNEDELTESILNTLGNNDDDLNSYDARDDSEFVLLGAVENCGPGRRRNSYQICVSVEDM